MRRRWLIVGAVVLATVTSGVALAQATSVDYIGMSKREILRRLGLPAEITLATGDAPAAEIWWYYYDDPYRGLTRADFQFTGSKVSGHAAFFDAKRLVSTETAQGFARVYRQVVKERKRHGE